jgi:hypothetical protein
MKSYKNPYFPLPTYKYPRKIYTIYNTQVVRTVYQSTLWNRGTPHIQQCQTFRE